MLQIRNSTRLRQVLRLTLAAGNALNVGTAHGGALGFNIQALLRLDTLKVINKASDLAECIQSRCVQLGFGV